MDDTNIFTNVICKQSECQQLICEILRATPEAASADAAVQTARLASKAPSKDKRQVNGLLITVLVLLFGVYTMLRGGTG